MGCSILKTMIEDDKLVFHDYDIINELTAFVSKRMTYELEIGHNDDLVMCMVIFAWWTSQNYFRDMTDVDVRKALFEEKQQQLDEELTPFGFIDDGRMMIVGMMMVFGCLESRTIIDKKNHDDYGCGQIQRRSTWHSN